MRYERPVPPAPRLRVEHNGATYYFCCTRCADKFRGRPEWRLSASSTGRRHSPMPVAGGLTQLGMKVPPEQERLPRRIRFAA